MTIFDSAQIGPGEIYALIGFRTIRPIDMDPVPLAAGLWGHGRLPFVLDDNWKELIGSVREEAIRQANLFLIAKLRSSPGETLGDEEEKPERRVFYLYQALLFSASVKVFDALFWLGGVHRGSGPEVARLSELSPPLLIPGAVPDEVTPAVLSAAACSVAAIAELEKIGGFKRIGRVWRIYQRALANPEPLERLHQFCRCIEGFVLPDIGKTTAQFRSRTELFVGSRHHDLMSRLYEIRSQIEHLHRVASDDWPENERDRGLNLLRDSAFVEELSRRCISRFLSNRELWPHFASDDALRQFWSTITAERRRELWGEPFEVDELRSRFNEQLVSDADLRLRIGA